jgi:hypothetical protein
MLRPYKRRRRPDAFAGRVWSTICGYRACSTSGQSESRRVLRRAGLHTESEDFFAGLLAGVYS